MLATAAVLLLAACGDDDDKAPQGLELSLTTQMVEVGGLSGAPLVNVDNRSSVIDIEIPYADKAKLATLAVSFVSLPDGVVASPNGVAANYANGARNNVTFTKGSLSKVYSVGAAVAAADPKFVTATLNEVPVTGTSPDFTAKLKSSDDLAAIKFACTVSPEETVVTYENAQGAYVPLPTGDDATMDFSDKLNGVNFKLTCDGVEKVVNIKVTTSGYSKITRVWGHYANAPEADTWYGTTAEFADGKVPASPQTDAWDRNIAMDDQYVYMARGNKGYGTGLYGVFAVKIADGTVREMSKKGITDGGGAHGTTDLNVIPDGSGTRLLVCNLANSAGNMLKVWSYTGVDSDATEVLSFTLSAGMRLGDKFTLEGTWQDGKLIFFDYTGNAASRRFFTFAVKNGAVSAEPTITTLNTTTLTPNSTAGMYRFSTTEYYWSGTAAQSRVFDASTWNETYVTPGADFPSSEIGDCFFEFNDQKYMAFIMLQDSWWRSELRVLELSYPTLAESLEKWNKKARNINLTAAEEEVSSATAKNANCTGKVCVRTIDGVTYLAAVATSHGVSLFKLEK